MSDETPPWHSWCGCYGCKAGNRVMVNAEKARRSTDVPEGNAP